MKKLILSIAMMTFIVGTISVSYGQETRESMKMEKNNVLVSQQKAVTQVDSVADFQNLTKASEIRFIENDKSIADLKLKNTTLDSLKKSATSKDIDLLELKNSFLRKELVSYKIEGKTDWKTFKKQFNSDMDKLTEDLENMKNLAIL
jgi:hypothetical protein